MLRALAPLTNFTAHTIFNSKDKLEMARKCISVNQLPSVGVKEGLSCVIFRANTNTRYMYTEIKWFSKAEQSGVIL